MLTYSDLTAACSPGGSSVLTSVTELQPAAGSHASVTPAKFVDGNKSVFAFETRFIDGEPVQAALVDSKQSSINRGEQPVSMAISDGHPVLSRIPRIRVTYEDGPALTDLDLPHRFADGHIRGGFIDDKPVTADDRYRSVRDSTPVDASAMLNTAPASLVFGGWDSTRKTNQFRVRSALVGETIGVLADQNATGPEQQSLRGGARVDPVAMSVKLDSATYATLVDDQQEELSPGNLEKNRAAIKKAKKGDTISAASLGLGGIPPSLDSLGGVSCRRIIRSWVLSFSALRQLRFGSSPEGNVAGRALLAAFGLSTLARAEQELYLRANCDLVEAAAPVVTLDQRFGESTLLDPITVEAADALLEEAMDKAEELGVAQWRGQVLEVTGNPVILGGAVDSTEDES